MKKALPLLILLLVSFSVGSSIFGGSTESVSNEIYLQETPDIDYGRGCCSSHGGQCGCQNGRVVCCDGTLSPSCRC